MYICIDVYTCASCGYVDRDLFVTVEMEMLIMGSRPKTSDVWSDRLSIKKNNNLKQKNIGSTR